MFLKSLYLKNFRNFEEIELHFSGGINIFWGNNAVGKTNLLEAIFLLSTGRSHRSQHLSELIREGAPSFYLEGEIVQNGVTQHSKLFFDGKNKKLQIHANTYSSFAPLLGSLPLIFLSPLDSELISGSPALRRRLANLHLAQSDPLYVYHLTRFWRAMKQRNCLLRSSRNEPIDCWEAEMVHSASFLYQARLQWIEELKAPLEKHGRLLSSMQENHVLRYHPSSLENYPQLLEKNRQRDKELGITTVGPHRDDLSFWIGNRSARLFGSEGQKKTTIAALKLAEWDRMVHRLSCSPLMAIDDLGLALDQTRQKQFRETLEKIGQVFITTPIPLPDFARGNHIHISSMVR